jgi:hypothetical protein
MQFRYFTSFILAKATGAVKHIFYHIIRIKNKCDAKLAFGGISDSEEGDISCLPVVGAVFYCPSSDVVMMCIEAVEQGPDMRQGCRAGRPAQSIANQAYPAPGNQYHCHYQAFQFCVEVFHVVFIL